MHSISSRGPAALVVSMLTAILSASCATLRAPATGAREVDTAEARAAWARLLERHVDRRGRVDFSAIAAAPRDLERYVAWIATMPVLERPAENLADLINAYNALALYNVIRSDIPESLDDRKVGFFVRTRFLVGGRRLSLRALENDVIRPLGDPRVHFALNCMVRSCPRLPRQPFRQESLDAQLERAAREFFRAPRHVREEPARETVRFNAILRFYTDDFLATAPTLIAYANRCREEPLPAAWEVAFLPYDWTVNRQP